MEEILDAKWPDDIPEAKWPAESEPEIAGDVLSVEYADDLPKASPTDKHGFLKPSSNDGLLVRAVNSKAFSALGKGGIMAATDSIRSITMQIPSFLLGMQGFLSGMIPQSSAQMFEAGMSGLAPQELAPSETEPAYKRGIRGMEMVEKGIAESPYGAISAPLTEESEIITKEFGESIQYINEQVGRWAYNNAILGEVPVAPEAAVLGDVAFGKTEGLAPYIGALAGASTELAIYTTLFKGFGKATSGVTTAIAARAALAKSIPKFKASGQLNLAMDEIKKKVVWPTRSALVDAFKEANKTGDTETMSLIIGLMNNEVIKFDAGNIKKGTSALLPVNPPVITDITGQISPTLVQDLTRITKELAEKRGATTTPVTEPVISSPMGISGSDMISKNDALFDIIKAIQQAMGEKEGKEALKRAEAEVGKRTAESLQKAVNREPLTHEDIRLIKKVIDPTEENFGVVNWMESEEVRLAKDKEVILEFGKPFKVKFDLTAKGLEAQKRQQFQDFTGGNPPPIFINELIQNSADAINKNRSINNIKDGTIKAIFDSVNKTVTFEDTGIGMTPEEVKTALTKIAEQGTKGAEDIGGFGFAKIVVFGFPETFQMSTWARNPNSKTGFSVTKFEGTKRDFFESGREPEAVPEETTSKTTGTRFVFTFDKGGDVARCREAFTSSMASCRVPVTYVIEDVISGTKTKLKSKTISFNEIPRKVPDVIYDDGHGNVVELIFEKVANLKGKTDYSGGYELQWSAYNKGLPLKVDPQQFYFESISAQPDFKLSINFKKTAPVEEREFYPFEWNRQKVKTAIKYSIMRKANEVIKDLNENAHKNMRAELKDIIENAPLVEGLKVVVPSTDKSVISKSLDLVEQDRGGLRILRRVFDTFSDVLEKTLGEKMILGLTTRDDVHGFKPNPEIFGEEIGSHLLINPWTVSAEIGGYKLDDSKYQPVERSMILNPIYKAALDKGVDGFYIMANNLIGTLIHEFAHKYSRGHYDTYCNYLHSVFNALGPENLKMLGDTAYEFYKRDAGQIEKTYRGLADVNTGWDRPDIFRKESSFGLLDTKAGEDIVAEITARLSKGESSSDIVRSIADREAVTTGVGAFGWEGLNWSRFTAESEIDLRKSDAGKSKDKPPPDPPKKNDTPKDKADKVNKLYQYLKDKRAKELYDDIPPQEEFLDPGVNEVVEDFKEVQAIDQSLHGKPITLGEVTSTGKGKGYEVISRIGAENKMEIVCRDKYGQDHIFDTLTSANEFLNSTSASKPDHLAAEKKYYEIRKKEVVKSPELIKAKFEKGKYAKEPVKKSDIIDLNDVYIDFVTPSANETPPIIRPELFYKEEGVKEVVTSAILRGGGYIPTSREAPPLGIGVSSFIKPYPSLFQIIEARSGVPIFSPLMRLQEGLKLESKLAIPYLKRLKEAASGHNEFAMKRMYKLLELPGLDEVNTTYRDFSRKLKSAKGWYDKIGFISEAEYESAVKIAKILRDAGEEFGIPIEKMLRDYAPRIRESGLTIEQARREWNLPEEYRWWAEEERTGYLTPHDENLYKVVHKYISRGARKKAIGSELESFTEIIKEAEKNGRFTKNEWNTVEAFTREIRGMPIEADAFLDATIKNFTIGLNKAIDAVTLGRAPHRYENVLYKRDIIEREGTKYVTEFEKGKPVKKAVKEKYEDVRWIEEGKYPGFFEVHNVVNEFVNMHLNLTYSGALGLRPMAFLRNLAQPLLTTLPITGPVSFVRGLKKAMTKEGMDEARANGCLLDDYLPVPGDIDKFAMNKVEELAHKTLYHYTKADNFNRAISYHAMKDKVLSHAEEFLNSTKDMHDPKKAMEIMNKFLKDTDIEFFHPVLIKNEVLPLLSARDIVSLSERMGRHLSDNTQWVYRRANSPRFTRGKVGKIVGQFGTWPAWYLDWLSAITTRGSASNRAKRISLALGVNASLGLIGKEIFGVDMSTWVWGGPLKWSGGPMVGAISNMKDLAMGDEYEKAKALGQLGRFAMLYVPGALALNGLYKAYEETRTEDQVKYALGFKPAEE